MPSVEDPRGGQDLVALRIGSCRPDRFNGPFSKIKESPQRSLANATTTNGEKISMCKCPIGYPNEISLSLTPGVLFASSNYWAFSVLVCVDEQVVEERFIDWGKATGSLHENYHAQGLERLSFDFDGLYSAPLRTFSIGFFVYYIDPLNVVKSMKPILYSVLAIRMIYPHAGGSDARSAPTVDEPFMYERRHPLLPRLPNPPRPGPITSVSTSQSMARPDLSSSSSGYRQPSIGTPVPPYEPPTHQSRSPSRGYFSLGSAPPSRPNNRRKIEELELEVSKLESETTDLRRKVEEKRKSINARKARIEQEQKDRSRSISTSSNNKEAHYPPPSSSSDVMEIDRRPAPQEKKKDQPRPAQAQRTKINAPTSRPASSTPSLRSSSSTTSKPLIKRTPVRTAQVSDSDEEPQTQTEIQARVHDHPVVSDSDEEDDRKKKPQEKRVARGQPKKTAVVSDSEEEEEEERHSVRATRSNVTERNVRNEVESSSKIEVDEDSDSESDRSLA